MRIHKMNPYLSIFTFMNVAINPYSMSTFIKIIAKYTLIKGNQCELRELHVVFVYTAIKSTRI